MCRWAAYRGAPLYLEEVVASPVHSLIAQSHCASQAKTATNGDGFGLAWYGERPEPGLYRDILPAWSDCNLKSMARQIRSPLFLAHVRASTSGGTRRDNCHPFVSGRWSFMHNGQIDHYGAVRRELESRLTNRSYAERRGTTDSELLFLLARDAGLHEAPREAFLHVFALLEEVAAGLNVSAAVKFTAAFSDGARLHAIRYASQGKAPTLYHAQSRNGHLLVSEPLDDEVETWLEIPEDSFVSIDDDGVRIAPFRLSAPALAKAS
jgi:predicted glutamine amidotransferase